MKKLLSLLATTTLVASATMPIIACSIDPDSIVNDDTGALPDKNFELESNSITVDTVNAGFIKVTNWSVLNDNSKPTKFTYDTTGIIQLTVSTDGQLITVSPLSNAVASTVNVTIESGIHSEVVTVTVEEITEESEFELDKTSVEMRVSETAYIKISNWDALSEKNKPSIFNVDETYATATLDSANKQIIVKSNSVATENTILVIESASGVKSTVSLKINAAVFDLAQSNLVVNLAAGNMVNGLVDPTIAVGVEGFTITDESVVSGFNTMNNVNLSSDDLEVVRDGDGTSAGNKGIAASYILRAKDGSENVKGEVLLTFNSNIDPLQYFANKNLGEIRLFSGAYNRLNEVLVSKDVISLAAIIFEQVGVKNPQLEYFKANFIQNNGAAGQAIMKNAVTNATTFQITKMPTLGGIFKEGVDVQFTYKFVEEDRITLSEGLPESGKIKVDVANLDDKSKSGQKAAKTEIYNQMNDDFKNQVSLSNFIDFTNIIFGTKKFISNGLIPGVPNTEDIDFKFDVLPGSEKLYGHDGAAFQGYIVSSGVAAAGTGGGNLSKYENSGSLDERYTTGMGFFTISGALSGNFYQGHDIMTLSQQLSETISDQTMSKGSQMQLDFELENYNKNLKVTVESSNSSRIGATIVENENATYTITFDAASGGWLAYSETITIKVNGYILQSFVVKAS